jgi:hypothetical protein
MDSKRRFTRSFWDIQKKELDSDKESNMSSSAGDGSVADLDVVESSPSKYEIYKDCFVLGQFYGLLKVHCTAMFREMQRNIKSNTLISRSLAERVEDAWFHADTCSTSLLGGFAEQKTNKERWGALASLFLQNRLNWLNMKAFGDDLPAEDEVDTRRSWPPRDLPKDWFDFEKSFDLLRQNRDALIHECSINSIPLPRCCCPDFNEHQILEDTRMKHYAKKLTSDPNGRLAAKNYWFFRVNAFMEDLLQFYSEMAFVNEDTSTCDGEGTKGDAENTV